MIQISCTKKGTSLQFKNMTNPGFNLNALISAANSFHDPTDLGNRARHQIEEFKNQPDSWIYANEILSNPQSPEILKFTAIQTLQNLVKVQWKSISEDQRQSVRTYLMEYVIQLGSVPTTNPTILTQANVALVGLLIQEWPYNFPNFITDLINSAGTSEFFCYNNISIIKILCEQSLENTEELITYARSNELAGALQAEAQKVYSFLEKVLTSTQTKELILVSLSTLKYFIKWIPPQVLLNTQVFQALCNIFLPQVDYVTEVLDLFSEIFGSNQLPTEFSGIVPEVFSLMIKALSTIINQNTDFNELLSNQEWNKFVKILAITLTIFLQKFGVFLETHQNIGTVQLALSWICNLTRCDEDDILKTCVEFWLEIARRCHRERHSNQPSALSEIYAPVLPTVRRCLIERMKKPDEIIIVEDMSGMIVREHQRNTLTIMLHSIMKECLVLLTAIDQQDTLNAIQGLIELLKSNWSPDVYNSICWSVGAITQTLTFEREKTFITSLLRIQLDMCQNMPDPNLRAIIASGIMYVCSKYPRFLQKFPVFLKTVVNKLFEFMHQSVEGVSEMAVLSFKTIATGCSRQFLQPPNPFIVEIIGRYPEIVSDLSPDLIVVFFDALSYDVSHINKNDDRREVLEMLMAPLNQQWQDAMNNFDPTNPLIARSIAFVLQCNSVIAFNIHYSFHDQFMTIFPQMMMVYQAYSQSINDFLQHNNNEAVKAILGAKSAIIEVIKNFISKTLNQESTCASILPDLVNTIYVDYGQSHPRARTPEVLNLLTVLFNKMKDSVSNFLSVILDAIFQPTVAMISADFDQNIHFRLPFYLLLKNLVDKYLTNLLAVPNGFDLLIQTIQWGYQHPIHDVCICSLETIKILLNNIKNTNLQLYNSFLSAYYLRIVRDMFQILTDTIHKFAFENNIQILMTLLSINTPHLNSQSITQGIMDLFPGRNPEELFQFVGLLISLSNDATKFRVLIRDFLVTTRQFNAQDPDLNTQEIHEVQVSNKQILDSTKNTEFLDSDEISPYQ
ncbi:Exportin-1 [Tritrichomonas foetus]|uniref:Exportin-1 n=1 Tax=Tritrichomonas foetus TaxID=1144522 RepID=A0A1J4L1M0_9EUKA|nr:Exportin-1 [Tritrichomonas foetus]|eukprot:OHT15868.1 Exportin-1 [Tritrichomonas foetus]